MTAAAPAEQWVACARCGMISFGRRYLRDLRTCASCGHSGRLSAEERIGVLADEGSVRPLRAPAVAEDPLEFTDTKPYPDRLRGARKATGLTEAVSCARMTIAGHPVVLAVMDFGFLGGSLGRAVGERITLAAEEAGRLRVPLVLVTASGGARMQEGALSLMQMAKTSQALAELDDAGVPTISVLTDPTYGGVAASFATLPDLVFAEEGARTGFAGPRVIEQTIGTRLPEHFQTAESLLRQGFVDAVLTRNSVRAELAGVLETLTSTTSGRSTVDTELVTDADRLPAIDPWVAVKTARQQERPTTLDYAEVLLEGFRELHGDRLGGDCAAIVGGIGRLEGRPVVLIGHQKGHTSGELVARDFGMGSPSGYRKAARLMRLAEKWRMPVVTLIDTPGAHPGIEAEEHGQAWAIADNLRLMSGLTVPVVSVVTGEGGSGGALALGVADRVFALSNAVYSVISPEGCAAILWKRRDAAPEAARALRLHAAELLRRQIVDGVIPEPGEGAHAEPVTTALRVRAVLHEALTELGQQDGTQLVKARRARFRNY